MEAVIMKHKSKENMIRRKFRNAGYVIKKSRRAYGINNWGGYQVIDATLNTIIAGENFNLELEELEIWLKE